MGESFGARGVSVRRTPIVAVAEERGLAMYHLTRHDFRPRQSAVLVLGVLLVLLGLATLVAR